MFPVQAKGGKDRISIVQLEQDQAMCRVKFPSLICHPIAAQFMDESLIALFAFEDSPKGLVSSSEKHYRLVPPEQVTVEDLKEYREKAD